MTKKESNEINSTKKQPTVRVDLDFPKEIYEQIQEEVKESGQTIQEFVLALLEQHSTSISASSSVYNPWEKIEKEIQ